jgi:predicted nucleotidyltransferase
MAGLLRLRSELRRRVLAYFVSNEQARPHVRELARMLDVDPTNLSRELARLEGEGIVRSELVGRVKQYRLDREYPFYRELRRMLQSSVGAAAQVRAALKGVSGIESAFLYGSFAKGNPAGTSDIDLLLIGRTPLAALEKRLLALEKRLGRQVNYTMVSETELRQKLKAKDPFFSDIWRGKKEQVLP